MSVPRCMMLIGALLLDSGAAWAQAATLAELEGAVIDVSSVYQEKVVGRDGNPYAVQMHTSGHFAIGAGGAITVQFQSTAVGPWGTRAGPTRGGTYPIGNAGKGPQGNDQVWAFANGELRRLVAHHEGGAGGSMTTIAFRRGPDGLRCSFSFHMARENGAGSIRKDAAVGDRPVEILEYKPVSSSCQVAKGSSSTR
jgi:hypothetical protein